ncbi:DNA repair protein RecN [Luteimonas sp. MC1750]|uniref:DNA repair protein RecN n=1 Tax=Luteimonas sp. MC1750 TaxID=2799326 RepID=UPI0018F0E357|nr:DNA repair protein RecN [Luteimonas sp. MC1750]MBJ6984622.1 DNA repair protein RecN [Luteimonas sp. MC1750]QQO04775.1 DNA repair protein RecN [Luteimonas sp. MC1750]
MLKRLSIKDFAVVSATELEFGPGLTVVSGETGAGKSLIVDALGFLSGLRADSGMVRHGAQRAELDAEFTLDDSPAALGWLREQEFDDGAACQLRRTLRADGGSRAWINGRPATLSQLGALAALLVEIHGQHEHQALLSRGSQLALLDAYGRHEAELAAVAQAARAWSALLREHERLNAAGDVSDRIDFLGHQLGELEREALEPDSIAELVVAHRRQAHGAELVEACDAALERLGGDSDALPAAVQQLRALLGRMRAHEARLGDVDALLEGAAIQLDEAAVLLDRIRADLDIDPARMQAHDARLSRLHELSRKHRVPVEDLASHRDALAAELEMLATSARRLEGLGAEITGAAAAWRTAAAKLGKARARAATALGKATTALVGELGMGGGRFEIALEPIAADAPDAQGAERAEFLVTANAGQPPRPLRKVASGGELSRISLAIEVAALGLDAVQTMVFDEVDSGIGGNVAGIVGRKLRDLGSRRQVLCVTHLPQVAAQGHAHYRVSKAERAGMTQSAVRLLDDAGRQEELARMLGGIEVSSEARAAARRLLSEAEGSPVA